MITLSGGLYGDEQLEWISQGIVEDGREYMIIDTSIYVKVSDSQAVFYGVA